MSVFEKVLVVDDDKFNVALLKELCQNAGYRVTEAFGGEEALLKIDEDPPDVVLLDIMMKGKNGFEVCQELRANQKTADLPIIIVTALDDLESKVKGIELGADDYVTKPFRLFELQQRIRAAIDTRRYKRELSQLEGKLQELGEVDVPGKIGGFRQLRTGMEYEFNRAERYQHSLSCVLVSIDDYNDVATHHGRKTALAVVSSVILVLQKSLRVVDRIYRLDEDEFVFLLPETPREGALRAIERIQAELQQPVQDKTDPIRLTLAVASYPHPQIKTGQEMLRRLSELQKKAQHESLDVAVDVQA